LQRSLNSVENFIEDAGTEFNGEGLFGSLDGVTDGETGCMDK
jgi:hypothetical protein